MTPTNADLRQFILQFFNDDELETLCFDYFHEVQQNFTAGMTKNRKAILLIGYGDTRGRLEDLYAALAHERPAEFGWGTFEELLTDEGQPATPPAGAEFMADNSEWEQAVYTLRAYELGQARD